MNSSIDNDQYNMKDSSERENVDYIKNKINKHNNKSIKDECVIEIPDNKKDNISQLTKDKEDIQK